MGIVFIEENNIFEYVQDMISDMRIKGKYIKNAKYHHNTGYQNAASICKHGILTLLDLNNYGIRYDSKEKLRIMNDIESHANGNYCISLSVAGMDDLYRNENEYDYSSPYLVDFRVTDNIKTNRYAINYGNEFLSTKSIKKEDLRSVDIRLLELIKNISYLDCSQKSVLKKYNYLRDIALEIKKQKLCIPIREMSDNSIYELDLEKLSNQSKMVLKKY